MLLKTTYLKVYKSGGGKLTLAYFNGRKYSEDKHTFFKNADMFVFPTFYPNECFPLVLLEAMQHHLPCISTTEGGIPGIIDDKETGFLIENHDFQTLADKPEYFIEHPEESKRMGENGYRKFHDKFTLKKFEESMVGILNNCLHSET